LAAATGLEPTGWRQASIRERSRCRVPLAARTVSLLPTVTVIVTSNVLGGAASTGSGWCAYRMGVCGNHPLLFPDHRLAVVGAWTPRSWWST